MLIIIKKNFYFYLLSNNVTGKNSFFELGSRLLHSILVLKRLTLVTLLTVANTCYYQQY